MGIQHQQLSCECLSDVDDSGDSPNLPSNHVTGRGLGPGIILAILADGKRVNLNLPGLSEIFGQRLLLLLLDVLP